MPIRQPRASLLPWSLGVLLLVAGCSGGEDEGGGPGGGAGRGAGGWPGREGAESAAAVPVETSPVVRRDVASYFETHGTLEAENEVDVLARVSAPVVEIVVEEGAKVRRGAVLARLDDREMAVRAEGSRVALEESRQAWERARSLRDSQLISPEDFDAAQARYDASRAQHEEDQIQLGYTQVTAPFSGLVVARYIQLGTQLSPGDRVFRLSDFDPLLCHIQVPERELPRLEVGQPAHLETEAWPGERFDASVLRIRPVVDAATGTVRVTLAMEPRDRLRPGMFVRAYVEVDRRSATLVIPKEALSLESLGDAVFVAENGVASRRSVKLGFREGDFVEVVDGLQEGEAVVTVGQDGLSDGTPVRVLGGAAGSDAERTASATGEGRAATGAPEGGTGEATVPGSGPGGGGPGFDPASLSAEELEKVKERMRARGVSEKEIEDRLSRPRERP